jgi:hypothetical protein
MARDFFEQRYSNILDASSSSGVVIANELSSCMNENEDEDEDAGDSPVTAYHTDLASPARYA